MVGAETTSSSQSNYFNRTCVMLISIENTKKKPNTEESKNIHYELPDKLNHSLETEKLYPDPSLTLTTPAKEFNTNREYLSRTINHCFVNSYTSYTNEYSIKTTIEIPDNNQFTPRSKSFPLRNNSFLLRKYSFPLRQKTFLLRKYSFLLREKSFLLRQYSFLLRQYSSLLGKYSSLLREKSFLLRKYSFLLRKYSILPVNKCFFKRDKAQLPENISPIPQLTFFELTLHLSYSTTLRRNEFTHF